MKLLADTGALLALFNPRDSTSGKNVRPAVGRVRFVLTDLILSETVTRLRARTDAARAADIGAALLNSRRYEVLSSIRRSSKPASPISAVLPTSD